MYKLVRDKILDIIRGDGREPEFKVVDGDEYITALLDKLTEEHDELKEALVQFMEDPDKLHELQSEVADVLEVVAAIVDVAGLDTEELFEKAQAKREDRGAFKLGHMLKIEK